jgi:hypothetical protein
MQKGPLRRERPLFPLAKAAMNTYQLWQHAIFGLFAVRLDAGEVTGVVGPLALRAAVHQDFDLAALEYDERPAILHRFIQSPEQFHYFWSWFHSRHQHARRRQ